MKSPFEIAAVKAFEDIYISILEGLPIETKDLIDRIEPKRRFAEKLATAFHAFAQCTTADKLDEKIREVVFNSCLAEMERAFLARKDWTYARERAAAIWADYHQPRLF